ncbi:MAG: hypothetical protein LBD08_00935 [Treponema sp.]|jgi:hypothetical protein|nr:hypothetical protein [Treponema sp.]
MLKIVFFVLLGFFLFQSCRTAPNPPIEVQREAPQPLPPPDVPPSAGEAPIAPEEDEEDEASFDPATVTKEEFGTVKAEVQALISSLNRIIYRRDYAAWLTHLSAAYFEQIAAPEFLAEMSEHPRLKTQKIILTSPQDYFMNVVIPSRANERVDDIEFVTHRRVKAFSITAKGQRLRLYDLQKTNEGWKIIN